MAEVADLVAALCLRLVEGAGPLAPEGAARPAAAAVIGALNDGAGDAELERLLGEVEAALVRAGLPHGLQTGDFRTGEPVRFRPLPGLVARAVHSVLRCPADRPCARLDRVTWRTRAEPPHCAVWDAPLVEERLR